MAKKKQKHLKKLNNKVKSLFGNVPFELALEKLDDDILYGIIMSLNQNLPSLDRKNLLKTIRRIWSEGNYENRKTIVEFLQEYLEAQKAQKREKIEFILSLLDNVTTTPSEDDYIINEFIDKKLSKITKEKVLNKLNYFRLKKFIKELEEELEITIKANEIEFSFEYSFEFNNQNFTLTLIARKTTDLDFINKEYEKKKLIEKLTQLKIEAKKEKFYEFEQFLNNLKTNPLFNQEDFITIFKSIKEPIEIPTHSPIPLKIIKKILLPIKVALNGNNFLLTKKYSFQFLDKEFEYDLHITYDKKALYSSIWTKNIVQIESDFKEYKEKVENKFTLFLDSLKDRLIHIAHPLILSEDEINYYLMKYIYPVIKGNRSLEVKEKIARRVAFYFSEEIKAKKEQAKKEELLAKTIRDFKKLFPLARSLKREIIFHVGPTNSGKTHAAMKELKKAITGVYLAPLRLLALEGYERLKEEGINVSLITGEEEIIDEESTHVSSTIEMLNSDIEVDVCVIDEIQMIADKDRGWAWANALIGAPAKKVIVTGSEDALDVVKALCQYLGEPLTIKYFERKNLLKLLPKPTPLKKVEPATAIVTFSRKEVLALKNKISPYFDVSVVYGNLSPEIRREEAKRFREGKSQILIATDAIAMGLNMPIKTILFAKDNKFDGFKRRELTNAEVLQIAGRAGRFGLHESGFVGALDSPTLSTISKKFNEPLKPLTLPVSVMASLEHVLLISEILQTQSLTEILEFFAKNMEFEGPFVAANIESMLELAVIVDEYELDLVSKYHLACAPVSLTSPYLEKVYHNILQLLEAKKTVPYHKIKKLPRKAKSYEALLNAEDKVKEVSLYLWLSFKFKDKFLDVEAAKESRELLNSYIERSLRESDFSKVCKKCGKELDISYKFMICDECYDKQKRKRRKK